MNYATVPQKKIKKLQSFFGEKKNLFSDNYEHIRSDFYPKSRKAVVASVMNGDRTRLT